MLEEILLSFVCLFACLFLGWVFNPKDSPNPNVCLLYVRLWFSSTGRKERPRRFLPQHHEGL